ncbi:MAG TPA: NrfD/PsrC family molybdoenzyme membrane anchor subunit [Solirubrobacteraceae bacterium]
MTGAPADSYYGRPILKEPVWKWEIPTYFFFGGMAGAAAPFALLSELRGDEALARRAWLVALAGAAASAPLLIADLGRPERFHRMLRVIKPTSPMSIGSWILGASSTAIGFANVRTHLGWFPRLGRLAGATAVLGPALSTYTAVLVADTAIPAWHEARRELPYVFASGAAMSAGSAIVLMGGGPPARRLALVGAAGELASTTWMERRLGALGEPYRQGPAGAAARAAKALTAVGGLVMAWRGRRRAGAMAGGALMLAGAMATRWSVYKAGFQSAADPKYVVEPQRARMAARAEASAR